MRTCADPTVFAAFALLNVVGYDREAKRRYSPVRERARHALLAHRPVWRDRLTAAGLLQQVQKGAGAPLLDVSCALGGPPDFAGTRDRRDFSASWQAESLRDLSGLAEMLRLFWREHELARLWDDALPRYQA